MFGKVRFGLGVVVLAASSLTTAGTQACPFCTPPARTLAEDVAAMDAVVVARLDRLPAAGSEAAGSDVPKATFQIVEVLKGGSTVRVSQTVETITTSSGKVGDKYLLMGVDPPRMAWSTPQKVSPRAIAYLRALRQLPEKGPERLAFFQEYLEDAEPLLVRDAYDEFARAPYADVRALKDKIDRGRVLRWIKDPQVPTSRRRLYLVLLSVCGGPQDLPLLEEMLTSKDRKLRESFDALIGCYLLLSGPPGMPLIEDLFLKNRQAEYADTFSAIAALRFHGTETDVIPRERIVVALRHLLDRPQLADLVIPDLARWQDWGSLERLVQLFKEADANSTWVRVPVVNFLRACPDPKAKKYLDELKALDPEAVRRAKALFPFGSGKPSAAGNDKTSQNRASELAPPPRYPPARDRRPPPAGGEVVAAAGSVQFLLRAAHARLDSQLANPTLIVIVVGLSGAAVMFAQWRLLSGAGRR